MNALSFSGAAVVETAVVGVEVAVGVVGTPGEALPAVEIVPKKGSHDYVALYGRSDRLLLAGQAGRWGRHGVPRHGARGVGRVRTS